MTSVLIRTGNRSAIVHTAFILFNKLKMRALHVPALSGDLLALHRCVQSAPAERKFVPTFFCRVFYRAAAI